MILGIPIFLAIIAFVSVVFVHELGHYLVGRWCGIGARTFSIGFGPKLFSYIDQKGTEWMLCAIPLGGFVKFLSDDESAKNQYEEKKKIDKNILEKSEQQSFESSTVLARSLTVLAGPFANFLMAVLIFGYVALVNGTTSEQPIIGSIAKLPTEMDSLMIGDTILTIQDKEIETFADVYQISSGMDKSSTLKFRILRDDEILQFNVPYLFQPVVFNVELFSPAMRAGIEIGDVFISMNGVTVSSFDDVKLIVNASNGRSVSALVWRDGSYVKTSITPEMRPTETIDGNLVEKMRIGVRGGPLLSPLRVTPSFFEAGHMGAKMTFYVIKTSLVGLARIIDNTISPKHLSGPIGVAKALSYSASEGSIAFLSLLAAISAGIGLINLLPIPILDGGHLVLFVYEFIFRAPPPTSLTKFLMIAGFFLLVSLMVFTTFNDIVR